ALHDALTMGSLGGYLRTFVAEEERLTPLLRHAAARISHRDYVKSIMAEITQAAVASPLGPSDMPDALSEREIDTWGWFEPCVPLASWHLARRRGALRVAGTLLQLSTMMIRDS
ncbi:MAG: hypothetical protein K0R44_3922, partial [Thermomicrobiales bacterium]|nr:hypothetical protein [Thermomicrobiales bacterium]